MNGILCISSKNDISLDNYLNYLEYIQHRGTQSFGYLNNNSMIHIDGLIHDYKNYDNFTSTLFLGYTTNNKINTYFECIFGKVYILMDGNIGCHKSPFDLLKYYIIINCENGKSFESLLTEFIIHSDTAFSIIVYINNIIYVMRDKKGIKPLMYSINEYGIHIASEINGKFKYVKINDVEPGSLLKIEHLKITKIYKEKSNIKHCLYEYSDIMNENTISNNINIKEFRNSLGLALAFQELSYILETKFRFVVLGIPNNSIDIANKYANYLNIYYEQLITKTKNTLIVNRNVMDKNIIIISKSNNLELRTIINQLYKYGINDLHVRIASPEIKYDCFYGIKHKSFNKINKYTSLKYINIDKINSDSVCMSCIKK
mgnify:CR=1 FL=1|tara:strand:- start:169 stop:1287 length:1119 start_codon:yes stop_codon:yes gene_type:complete